MNAINYPVLVETTTKAAYWEVARGVYNATTSPKKRPANQAGYRNLEALKALKGDR